MIGYALTDVNRPCAQNPSDPNLAPCLHAQTVYAVVPVLRHGRPSPWANTKVSRITVAEYFVCPILIIANWQCSIASARQPRAVCTSTPLINSLHGIAPSLASPSTA